MGINLHIVRNGVFNDSRVLKETESMRETGAFDSVEIVGFEYPGLPEHEDLNGRRLWRVDLASRRLPRDLASQMVKFSEWSFKIIKEYRNKNISLIHCNDLAPLPIAIWLKRISGAGVVYDAHELETERAGSSAFRNFFYRLVERHYMRKVDAVVTVSPSIQRWYRHKYPNVPVGLVRNIPLNPRTRINAENLRSRLKVPDESLLFIYLGGHAPGRGIHKALKAFSSEGMHHHVVFVGDGVLADDVRRYAGHYENIHWLAPVKPEKVLEISAGADVGLSLIEDISLSYRYALPNKLFECWIAGIPVLVSNLPDQSAIVQEYNAGWIAEDNESELAVQIRSLDHLSLANVEAGVAQLRSSMSWENEARELSAVYRNVLDGCRPFA